MNDAQRKAAAAAWQAYNAMEATKRRHFDYLTARDSASKKFNLPPTERETEMLKGLLRDHDEQVKAFKTASQALRQSDPQTFDALWAYINEINQALEPLRDHEIH